MRAKYGLMCMHVLKNLLSIVSCKASCARETNIELCLLSASKDELEALQNEPLAQDIRKERERITILHQRLFCTDGNLRLACAKPCVFCSVTLNLP